MANTFNFDFPGSPNDFVVKADKTISANGGNFEGNRDQGSFNLKTLIGHVKGNYKVVGVDANGKTNIAVTITQKPFLVPMAKIQDAIQDFF